MYKTSLSRAFTIVELLVVVVVIAILAAITVVSYNGITQSAGRSSAMSSLGQAAKKISLYYNQHGAYPAKGTLEQGGELSSVGINDSEDAVFQLHTNTVSQSPNYCITYKKGSGSGAILGHVAGELGGVNMTVLGTPCVNHRTPETDSITAANINDDKLNCPVNFTAVPGNSLLNQNHFCVMKFEAKIQGMSDGANVGMSSADRLNLNNTAIPESRPSGTPWTTLSQAQAIAASRRTANCNGCELISSKQWLTIAYNVMSVPENWTGGSVGSGILYNGNSSGSSPGVLPVNDEGDFYDGTTGAVNQRRTYILSNGSYVWDMAGNVSETTSDTLAPDQASPGNGSNTWDYWRSSQSDLDEGGYSSYFAWHAFPSAKSWHPTFAGIGFYSSSILTSTVAVNRGGYVGNGGVSGVMSGTIQREPGFSYPLWGFRAALDIDF